MNAIATIPDELITPAQAAVVLHKTVQTILRWLRTGELAHIKVKSGKGHRYLIPREAVLSKMELVGAGVPLNGTPPVSDPATDEDLKRHGLA